MTKCLRSVRGDPAGKEVEVDLEELLKIKFFLNFTDFTTKNHLFSQVSSVKMTPSELFINYVI